MNTIKNANVIPTAALQRNNDAAYVYVIDPADEHHTRPVTVVTTNGLQAAVNGVKPGETLVTDGFDKCKPKQKFRFDKTARRGMARPPTIHPPPMAPARTGTRRGRSSEPVKPIYSAARSNIGVMAAILLVGIVSYKQLPVSALPEVDYPTMQVVTFYPGASPEVIASAITAPLERQLGEVPG